jgi:hypothetical protein
MTDTLTECPICGTPRPANRASNQPWCCSIPCYYAYHHITPPIKPEEITTN